jgi:hypothetical protein
MVGMFDKGKQGAIFNLHLQSGLTISRCKFGEDFGEFIVVESRNPATTWRVNKWSIEAMSYGYFSNEENDYREDVEIDDEDQPPPNRGREIK